MVFCWGTACGGSGPGVLAAGGCGALLPGAWLPGGVCPSWALSGGPEVSGVWASTSPETYKYNNQSGNRYHTNIYNQSRNL